MALKGFIMGLEGPAVPVTPRDIVRGELNGAPWHPYWYKFGMSPQIWFGVFGVLTGGFLAGTARGQAFVRRLRRR